MVFIYRNLQTLEEIIIEAKDEETAYVKLKNLKEDTWDEYIIFKKEE